MRVWSKIQQRLLASLNYMRDHLVSPSIISVNTGRDGGLLECLGLLELEVGSSFSSAVKGSKLVFFRGLQLLEKSPGPSWIRCLQLLALAGRLWVRRDAVSAWSASLLARARSLHKERT